MATTYYNAIQSLYVAYFNRPADYAGLQYWESVVEANKGNTAAVSAAFAASAEYKTTYGGQDYYTVVNKVYMNLFGRPAELAGLQNWANLLTAGKITIDGVVTAISNGAQGTDKTAFNDKVSVATAFTNALDSATKITSYASASGADPAKQFLSTVTDDASAATALANVNATIDQIVYAKVLADAPTYTLASALQSPTALPTVYKLSDATINLGNHLSVAAATTQTAAAQQIVSNAANNASLNLSSTYSLQDTLANISSANSAVLAGASSYALNDANIDLGANLTATAAAAAVAQAQGLVNGATNKASLVLTPTYTLSDTLANLAANSALVTGHAYTLTDASGNLGLLTAAQAALVAGASDAANYTYQTIGSTLTLASGIDAVVGTTGNDTINATDAAGTNNLSSFDSVDGGAGNDTLNFVATASLNTTTASSVTVKNIESVSEVSAGLVTTDTTNWTGVTALSVASNGGESVKAATTTTITASDANLTTGTLVIDGGSTVTVAAAGVTTGSITIGGTTAPVGAVTVTSTGASAGGTTLGTITVTGGTTVAITQKGGNAVNTTQTNGAVIVNGKATTTSVTVANAGPATASATVAGVTENSVAITDVNLGSTTKAGTITKVNVDGYSTLGIADTALTDLTLGHGSGNIIIDNSGLTTPTNKTLNLNISAVTGGVLDDADIYTTLNVTTGATKSTLANVTLGALTTLNVAGSTGLTLAAAAGMGVLKTVTVSGAAGLTADLSSINSLTSVDTSATTGASTVTVNAANATFTGGAGVDKVTLSTSTVSKAVNLGAGNDTLTLSGGTTLPTAAVSGGAGTDTLVMNADDAHTAGLSTAFAGVVTGFEVLQLASLGTPGNNSIDLGALGNYTSVTTGGIAIGAGNTLTLQNFAAGGTLTLTADAVTGSYALSNSAFTAGTNDTVNIALTKAGLLAAGTVDVTGVENVIVTTADTQSTPTNPLDTLTLTSTSAKSITVSGNAGLNLTDTATTLTSVDASGITKGAFTFTTGALAAAAAIKGSAAGTNTVDFSAATGGAVTYTGGSGSDAITASNGKNNVLTLGDGNNTVTGTTGNQTITAGKGNDSVTLSTGNNSVSLGDGVNTFTATTGKNTYVGGAGVDTVTVGGGMNSITTGTGADVVTFTAVTANGNSYSTINDPHSTLKIVFTDAGQLSGTSTFNSAKVALADTAVFQDYLDAAVAGDGSTNSAVSWFQYNGNTYIVEDNSAASTFQNAGDSVVKLVGLVDISTATFTVSATTSTALTLA